MTGKKYILEFALFASVIFILFGKSIHYEFLYWDDIAFITDNPFIREFSLSNIWTMFEPHFGILTPVYWLSLAIDYQLYGEDPAGYRITNMILHVVNMLLVLHLFKYFFKSKKYTQTHVWLFGMAIVLIWGIHPLRVESVVWLSQRRDVLVAFFELLCVIFYLRSNTAEEGINKKDRYLSIFFFFMAIMTKPSAVPIPIVLILLDFFPLQRIQLSSRFLEQLFNSCCEKWLYFTLTICSAVLTIYGHHIYKALAPLEMFTIEHRFGNAIFGIAFYVIQTICPSTLLPFYPRQSMSICNPILLSSVALYGLIAYAIIRAVLKDKRYWLIPTFGIYVAMLLPILGIFQGGNQGAGDRFTYMSTIPFFFLLGWVLLNKITKKWIWICVGIWSVLLIIKTVKQQDIWENDETFYASLTSSTAYQMTSAYNKLALTMLGKGKEDEALVQFMHALNKPGKPHELAGAANCIGNIYFQRNQIDLAESYYIKATQHDPKTYLAHNNLGNVNVMRGKQKEAIDAYTMAISIEPRYSGPYYNLGKLYMDLGQLNDAIKMLEKSIELSPEYEQAHILLQQTQTLLRKKSEAE